MMTKNIQKQRNVYVFAIEQETRTFLVNELQKHIGEFAHISSVQVSNQKAPHTITPDLVVTAGELSHQIAVKQFPNCPIVVANRNLSLFNLEQLCLLPEGKVVLVINYSEEATKETIKSLIDKGIDHIKYIPYWPSHSIDTKEYDMAISPGMLRFCPNHIKKKIDIGMREIALSTYMQIMSILEMDPQQIDFFSTYYIQKLVDSYKILAIERQRSEAIKYNKQFIIDQLNEGYIFVDKFNRISSINHYAEQIFGLKKNKIIGEPLPNLFTYIPELSHVVQNEQINKTVYFHHNDETYVGSYFSLMKESGENFLIKFNKVSNKQTKLSTPQKKPKQSSGYEANWTFDQMIGKSKSFHTIIQKGKMFAKTNSTVLITGESGTGKELIAQAIHNESDRKNEPFIAVNFAAFSESLIDSELFGYEEGAFTGAKRGGKKGLFEKANNGTIFLDEIGDASHQTQKRLLRVLQEKEIMRIGSARRIPINVKIIAATNRNLEELIKRGLFREDLFFRLKVCHLMVPPLRKRKEDIPLLIEYFMSRHRIIKNVSPKVKAVLLNYDWPGNVRELDNLIEYFANVCQKDSITAEDLPLGIHEKILTDSQHEKQMTSESKIVNLFNKEDIIFILQTLSEHKKNNKTIGRKKLSDLAQQNGLNLTESKIRTRLKHMEKEYIVMIGRTKQGILITSKGEKLLNTLTS